MKFTSNSSTRSLLQTHLLSYQMYAKSEKLSFKIDVKNLIFELKQALKVIYLYTKTKKKILFIGFPYNMLLRNQSIHYFMSKKLLLKNINLNKVYLKKNPKLIVINNFSISDEQIVKKFEKQHIPIIIFIKNRNDISNKKFYNVEIFSFKPAVKKLLYFTLFSILNKEISVK